MDDNLIAIFSELIACVTLITEEKSSNHSELALLLHSNEMD